MGFQECLNFGNLSLGDVECTVFNGTRRLDFALKVYFVDNFRASISLYSAAMLTTVIKNFKQTIKRFVLTFCPSIYHRRVARHLRGIFKDRFFPFQTEVRKLLFGEYGQVKVLTGPFRGLSYFNEVFYFSSTPRWLGTYEMELHSTVEEIITRSYAVVIDVGCAEGYYALGLAKRCPNVQVYAFDVDPWSRDQCKRLSKLNGLSDRVHVRSWLYPKDIRSLIKSPTLIICDIEGYEMELIDPVTCPALIETDLLVEIHDFKEEFGGQIEASLIKRFSKTHEILVIPVVDRLVSDVQPLFPSGTLTNYIQEAMEEYRPKSQKWVFMKQSSTN